MIAMGLIGVVTVYLIVLLLAGVLPRGRKAKLISVGVVLSPIIYWCFDIPIGYVQFRLACEREGGLKIYEPITKAASVVRFDAAPRTAVSATGVDVALAASPWLQAIEAADPEFNISSTPVYARYERVNNRDSTANHPTKSSGALKITRIDVVEQTWPQVVVRPGVSSADYILSRVDSSRAIRQYRQEYVLKTPDGRVAATAANLVYSWSDSHNTLLSQSIKVSRCPDGWQLGTSKDGLLKLTSGGTQ